MSATFIRARHRLISALRRLLLGALSTYVRTTPYSRTAMTLSDIGGILLIVIADGRLSLPCLGTKRRHRPRSDSNPHEQLPLVALHSPHSSADLRELQLTECGPEPQATNPTVSAPRVTPSSASHQRRVFLFTFALVLHETMRAIDIKTQALKALTTPTSDADVENKSILITVAAFLCSASRNGMASCPPYYQLPYSRASTNLGLMAIALVTTLRLATLPISSCKRHLLLFAAVPPIAKLLAFTIVALFQLTMEQYQTLPLLFMESFTVSRTLMTPHLSQSHSHTFSVQYGRLRRLFHEAIAHQNANQSSVELLHKTHDAGSWGMPAMDHQRGTNCDRCLYEVGRDSNDPNAVGLA